MPLRRTWFRIAVPIAALLLLCPLTVAAEDFEPLSPAGGFPAYSFAPLIEKAAPAVVNIYARKIVRSRAATRALDASAFWRLFRDTLLFGYGQERIENSLGSGVIVSADGVIVTNHHVVADAEGVLVALIDGRVYVAEILVSDRRSDIAVLRIRPEGSLPFIEFGDAERLRVGDPVIAIGNPFGLGQTVTTGIVSALARTTFGVSDFRFFIQTDAAINPGNSGGAQISLDGKLIGINTAIHSTSGGSQGLGFAIPVSIARPIVENAIANKPMIYPWIGISGRNVPPQAAGRLGLPGSHGVLVTGVYKGGPASIAGFSTGDVVLTVNGIPVDDPQALRYRIAIQPSGSIVRLRAVRGGRQYEIPVTVIAPPDVPARNETRLFGLSPLRGAMVASLSPALAEEIGADSGLSGVVVLAVGQGSAAARLGLHAGDIIQSIDGRGISTVAELMEFHVIPFSPWRMTITRAGAELAIDRPAPLGLTR
ncbi:MAG: trypsin-like peptidase domain-containing protein [Aestuariivirga sp.]